MLLSLSTLQCAPACDSCSECCASSFIATSIVGDHVISVALFAAGFFALYISSYPVIGSIFPVIGAAFLGSGTIYLLGNVVFDVFVINLALPSPSKLKGELKKLLFKTPIKN